MSDKKNRIGFWKRIKNSLAYQAFLIGKKEASEHLAKVENEEIRRAGELSLEVADDVVHILTDEDPANKAQLESYLKDVENRQKVLDMSLAGLRGVAIEVFEDEAKLNVALEMIGVLAKHMANSASDEVVA